MKQRGFALLIVLWLLVPISAMFITLASAARTDSQRTFNLRAAARLDAAADGGVANEVFALLQSRQPAPLRLTIGGVAVTVAVKSLAGLINPNLAPPELLRTLLAHLGVDPAQATKLATAIVDWRTPRAPARPNDATLAAYRAAGLDYGPPGAPFQSIDEMRLVLGMTPALLDALRPNLTVYADRPPDPAAASVLVRAALADLGQTRAGDGLGDVFEITAEAATPGGARARRSATVKLGAPANGRPWSVLAWGSPPES